jgi:Fur family peroxide stress response transcriptional regulator
VRIIRQKPVRKPVRNKVEAERWCVEFESLCKARGIRVTAQRLAVYRALAEDASHPTADSVYKRLRSDFRGLSQATVYRTLEFLEQEKLIRRVSAPEAVGRFDANISNHQHLVCRVCGSLGDVSVPDLGQGVLPAVAGFTVEELDIRLVGYCHGCRESNSRPSRRRGRPANKPTS